MKYKNIIVKKLLVWLPEFVIGKRENFEREFYLLYGSSEKFHEISNIREQTVNRYVSVMLVFIVFAVSMIINSAVFQQQEIYKTDAAGKQYIERPAYDEGILKTDLIFFGTVGEETVKAPVSLIVKPEDYNLKADVPKKQQEQPSGEIALENLSNVIYLINKADEGRRVYLPQQVEGFDDISWQSKKNDSGAFMGLLFVVVMLGIYSSKYDKVKSIKKKAAESIEDELPEFISKLVLLMNGGLVLTSAFEKIVSDYDAPESKNDSYFYNQLREINLRVQQTNAHMIEELNDFAQRSKNREFMRTVNVIADNMNKGSELVEVLKTEGNFLWFQRKKRAEEKGRIAETKLTLPLAMQLMVLIIITVAPAVLEM